MSVSRAQKYPVDSFDEALRIAQEERLSRLKDPFSFRIAAVRVSASLFGRPLAWNPHPAMARSYETTDTEASSDQVSRTIEELVAEELQLTPQLSEDALQRLRRRFAMRHHPDKYDFEEFSDASRHMGLANQMIDEALRVVRRRNLSPRN